MIMVFNMECGTHALEKKGEGERVQIKDFEKILS